LTVVDDDIAVAVDGSFGYWALDRSAFEAGVCGMTRLW
jgi:hypothetical protein